MKSFKTLGIEQKHLEKYIGKQLTVALKEDLVDLRGVYKAIKDGQSKPEDLFPDMKVEKVATEAQIVATQNRLQAALNKAEELKNANS